MKTIATSFATYTLKDFVTRKIAKEYTNIMVNEEKTANIEKNTKEKMENFEKAQDFLFTEMVTSIIIKDEETAKEFQGKQVSEMIDSLPDGDFDKIIAEINAYKKEIVPKA